MRFLQANDEVFVTLDRGRGKGRGSGAPVAPEFVSIGEVRGLTAVRVRQYNSREPGPARSPA